jgi:5'-3' exonuclease
MGIEKFFSSIEENIIATNNSKNNFTEKLKTKLEAEYLCLDFNSIVHVKSSEILHDLNKILFYLINPTTYNTSDSNLEIKNLMTKYKIKPNSSYTDFLKYIESNGITSKTIDDFVINDVVDYVYKIITEYVDSNTLKYFYIAIDGVPSKSKMIEQKKRRYMGSFLSIGREFILNKNKNKMSENRYFYEKNKINWSKANISPGTDFMDKMNSALSSLEFKNAVFAKCPNLVTYLFSGPYVYGEGEKKIVDYIQSLESINHQAKEKEKENYVIYSPDSDMTLLGLLLHNYHIANLKLLRHNQQNKNYDVIDIDKLHSNLFSYIFPKLKGKNSDKKYIIADIVFILTMFGNDFLPKIESLNVKYDFETIIDAYILSLNQKSKYIINYDSKDNKKYIDFSTLVYFIEVLSKNEYELLQQTYASNNYKNYSKLKHNLGVDKTNFVSVLNEFLEHLANLNRIVKTNGNLELVASDNTFMTQLKNLAVFDGMDKLGSNMDFLKSYVAYYGNNKKIPNIKVNLVRHSKSITSDHNVQKLRVEIGSKMELTAFDTEMYKFMNMSDEYQTKLNAESLDLGKIIVYTDSDRYILKTDSVSKSIKNYYLKFFSIANTNIQDEKMNNVLSKYVEGLIWVFNYYYNDTDIVNFGDMWYNKYHKAPLLHDIKLYLQSEINANPKFAFDMNSELRINIVPINDYFNCLEHLLISSSADVLLHLAPPEYHSFIKHSNYYPDIEQLVNRVLNNKTNEIDCRGSMYITKCMLRAADFTPISDIEFIKKIRAIKLVVPNNAKIIKTKKDTIQLFHNNN